MNALTLLKQDHQAVESLFERFEKAGPNANAEKRRIAEKLIERLSTHAAIEEQLFYPAVRAKAEDQVPTILEALEEHHAAKLMLSELEKTPPTAERFDAKFTVLMENVRHHVEEEETDLFPKVREAFTVQELEELGDAMAQAKQTAPTRPHPFQPDEPPANVLLGMPVAVLDRLVTTGKQVVGQTVGKMLNRR
jgi:hemerythrin superfamily protein